MQWMATGFWSIRGEVAYHWCHRWTGRELAIGGLSVGVKRATLLATGESIRFEQSVERLVLKDLPELGADEIAVVSVMRFECDGPPRQLLPIGYEPI